MKFISLALACAASIAPVIVLAQPAPVISAEAFAGGSGFDGLVLSPDGRRILARATQGDQSTLAVAGVNDKSLIVFNPPKDRDLVGYRWAGNDRILFWVGDSGPFGSLNDQYFTRTFVYDLTTQKTTFVGPKAMGPDGANIIWVSPNGDRLLLAAQADITQYPSVYDVDLASGKSKLIQTPYDNTWDWYADNSGRLRVGATSLENGWSIKYRGAQGSSYATSKPIPYTNDEIVKFSSVIGPDSNGYVFLERDGYTSIYRYDFAAQAVGEKIFGQPGADITDAIYDDDTGAIIGVSYADDSDHIVWLNGDRDKEAATLSRTFGNRQTSVVSRSKDGKTALLWVGAPNDPGSYYVYQPDTGQLARIARLSEGVDRAALSLTKAVTYKARDGLPIGAYLTLPQGREPKGLPLIVMPHGGPYGVRDVLEYNAEVQFLANRGYAVLQPNYRGSGGLGRAFADAGAGEWGRKMQDDLDDGTDWLVKEGVADAKRVCLVGSSYGGYAALWGATRNPDRYRCAVSFAGVSNLGQQLEYQSDFLTDRGTRRNWRQKVKGESQTNLLNLSPISKAADLRVPVMLVHGDKDKRVPLKQSAQYAKALEAAGKPFEYYVYPGAGHGFDKPSDEASYFLRLEAFLKKFNPAG